MLRYLLVLAVAVPVLFAADTSLKEGVGGLIRQRQWAEAEAMLDKVIAAEPRNAEAWSYLGQIHLERNEAEKSVDTMERAAALDPKNSRYQRMLGDAYGLSALKAGLFSKLGWATKCKAAYDKAVELDPTSIHARLSLMEFCRQAPGFIGGGLPKAYEQAAEIKKLDSARGRQAYAGLYVSEKKYPEAFGLYEEVLRDHPGDDEALYEIGRLSATSGEHLDRGLAALEELLRHAGKANNAPANTQIARILERKGDKPGARKAYETALTGNPAFVPALEGLRKLNGT